MNTIDRFEVADLKKDLPRLPAHGAGLAIDLRVSLPQGVPF